MNSSKKTVKKGRSFANLVRSAGSPGQSALIVPAASSLGVDPERRLGLNKGKYKVTRTDGSSRKGKKHERCQYFVLDLQHDKFFLSALRAYSRACKKEYPKLAADIQNKIFQLENRFIG
jgi:hypothetical protein